MSLEYPDTTQIWISADMMVRAFSKNYNIGLSITGKVDVVANTSSRKTCYYNILIDEVGHLPIRIS